MLRVIRNLRQLDFSQLMEVYLEGNLEKGNLLQAEQDFYQYLKEGFFTQPDDRYCLWVPEGKYVAALRLQRYRDGLLLEALETAPQRRRKGCAEALVRAVLETASFEKVYVHIAFWNKPSVSLHEKCGFRKILDHAVYADGTYTDRSGTWLYEKGVALRDENKVPHSLCGFSGH